MKHPDDHDCDACDSPGRRDFVQRLSLALAGLAVGLAIRPDRLAAFPVAVGSALGRVGDEVRYAIPDADGATIDHDHDTILARYQSKVYLFDLACPHRQAALRWEPEDNQFQCPRHHSRYTPDGVYVSGRATRNMDRFALRREANTVIANVDQGIHADDHPSEWSSAFIQL